MIDDYYNTDELNARLKLFKEIASHGDENKFYDDILRYLELPDSVKNSFDEKFEIDEDAYLFYLLRCYALTYRNIRYRKLYEKHPYIENVILDEDNNRLETLVGDAEFQFWIKGLLDILGRSIKNINYEDLHKTFDLFFKEYSGYFNGKCHEGSIAFSNGNKVITGLIKHPIKNLRILHSFVEGKKYILDPTINALFSKEEYFRLNKPEIITEITGEELFSFKEEYMSQYPRLRNMSTKQMLVEFEEIKKHPKTIKLRPY